jgi:hypothetical protein
MPKYVPRLEGIMHDPFSIIMKVFYMKSTNLKYYTSVQFRLVVMNN